MNNYKLYIQKSGSWSIVDLGDDKPAMNYQVNNIAELKDRQCDYSQALKLPLSKNNCILFDIPESMDVVSNIQYIKIPCRLYSNESLLAGPGSFLVIDKVNEFIEVAILSGNADFFSIIDRPMSELDLGSILRDEASIDPANFTDMYCFAYCSYSTYDEDPFVYIQMSFPFINLKKAITELVTQNGYTLETNLLDAQWNRKAISIYALNPSSDSFAPFNAAASKAITFYDAASQYIRLDISNDGGGLLTQQNALGYSEQAVDYKAPIDCDVTISVTATRTSAFQYDMCTLVIKNMTSGDILYTDEGYNLSKSITISVSKDTVIRLSAYRHCIHVGSITLKTATFHVNSVFSIKADKVPVFGRLHFSNNIGFDTQLDLFKNFVQLFGLTVGIDNETKTVKAYTMQKLYDNKQKLYDNKAIAKDWSNKLHDVRANDIYNVIPGYAQSNVIKFTPNTIDNITDSGSFSVNQDKLDVTKELFTMKFESGIDRNIWIVDTLTPVANIPLLTLDAIKDFKGGNPHIVEISTSTIQSGDGGPFYSVATHVKAQTLIDTFYTGLINMLTSPKYAEAMFFLSDQDIEEFNQEIL